MVCNFVAPKAYDPILKELSIAFKDSSVVLITIGKTNKPNVNEPAIIESPNPSVFTNNDIPNNPNTIEGIPAKLFVISFMKRLNQLSFTYSLI